MLAPILAPLILHKPIILAVPYQQHGVASPCDLGTLIDSTLIVNPSLCRDHHRQWAHFEQLDEFLLVEVVVKLVGVRNVNLLPGGADAPASKQRVVGEGFLQGNSLQCFIHHELHVKCPVAGALLRALGQVLLRQVDGAILNTIEDENRLSTCNSCKGPTGSAPALLLDTRDSSSLRPI